MRIHVRSNIIVISIAPYTRAGESFIVVQNINMDNDDDDNTLYYIFFLFFRCFNYVLRKK